MWDIILWIFLFFMTVAVFNIIGKLSLITFFVWLEKPNIWIIFMGLLAFLIVFIASLNSFIFKLMSIALIAFPLMLRFADINFFTDTDDLKHASYKKAYKFGLTAYIICSILTWIFFFGFIIDTNQLLQ